MRRIVCRFTSADIALLDEVRARFPKVRSRAALIRALCIMGLTNAEQAPKVTP